MRVTIDSKGLNESNPEAGTSLNVVGNIIATGLTVNGPISGSSIAITVPNSPTYYCASTGSDTNTGAISSPLLTVQEAVRRLDGSGWKTQATVVSLDTLNFGANPFLSVPPPVGGAKPICFRGPLTTAVSGILCTGGTAGTFAGTTISGATFTSADASALNTRRGEILSVIAGANISGSRFIIHSNDGAGTFTIPHGMISGLAPVVGNTFDILSRAGKWTWTGTFTVTGEMLLADMEMLPTIAASTWLATDAWIQETGMKWTAAASVQIVGQGVNMWSGFWNLAIPYTPTDIVACGNRYDGANGPIVFYTTVDGAELTSAGNSYQGFDVPPGFPRGDCVMSFQGVTFNDSGFVFGRRSSVTMQLGIRLENCRSNSGGSSAVFRFENDSHGNYLSGLDFGAGTVTADLIRIDIGSSCFVSSIGGQAPAGKFFLNILTGGTAVGLASNTATGGTPGQDISVDGGTAFPVADGNTMGVIGAQNGSFQHSTSNLGANPTINKFSGFSAVQLASTTCVITNSIADVGDHVDITPTSINAAVTKYSAVATLNTITVTTDAAPTGAVWSFSWKLTKATV